ncbi:hypothetical protein BCR44DRAFT_1435004 [Catenaria anguillulae PL171]|uniref:Uncharacterized protein n=1 Tax=Catenaria anguillulae PL171 TaxID=765915 RepID=A0A1Y2HMN8_9FUNG|nr:hypothetical protein BCR44DRAFT_1435004 [Catenaria anguillulae PL171]
MTQLIYPEEWAFEDFIDVRVVVAQVACVILTVVAIILPAIKLHTRTVKSPFFLFCLIVPIPCLVADVSYFLTISRVITINQNEVPRVMSAFISLWLVCTLSSVRFRAFHKAGTVLWYDDRRSRIIVSILFLQGVTTTSILAYTYASQAHLPHFPTHPWRKVTIALQAGTSIFVNFVIDAFSFMTIWQIRMGVLRRNQGMMQQSMSTKATITEPTESTTVAPSADGPNDSPNPGPPQISREGARFWWWVPASALARIRNELIDALVTIALTSSPPLHSLSFAGGSSEKVNSSSARQLPSPTAVTTTALMSLSSDSPSSPSLTLLHPNNGSKSTSYIARQRRRKSREQKRLARFKQTTGIVLCMLGFLLLSSIIGLVVYLNLAHLFGDTMSAVAARIYIVACFVNWTILAQVVR